MKVYASSLYGNPVNFQQTEDGKTLITLYVNALVPSAPSIHTGVGYCLFSLGSYRNLHTDKQGSTLSFCGIMSTLGPVTFLGSYMNDEIVSRIKAALQETLSDYYPQGVSLRIKYIPGKELRIEEIVKNSRKRTPRFRVKYDADHYSCEGRFAPGVRVLADVICHVGPERVEYLNIRTSGNLNLVQKDPSRISSKRPVYLKEGFWSITQTANSEKKDQIRRIMEAVGENWEIEDES